MFYNQNDPKSVEKYSSAVTLSDMEIFIFPELMYSLVLSNILSPILWEWKKDPWFAKMKKLNEYRRILRVKQFIMERFTFNLDLDTWGLTTKEQELERFKKYIDKDILSRSNALFGYEGDKYYFDIDIRRHFGLDKYTSNVIPYWKTETIEAMEAFKHKDGYPCGAGECVSFSTLYAAALHVIGNVPLNEIHLIATPLHSQNFIDVRDGLICNNRRLLTKNMWFNGTELSAKARRAIENENITMIVNNSGYVHALYDDATMPEDNYNALTNRFKEFLTANITYKIVVNFIRQNRSLQKSFQMIHACCGKPRFIEAEKVFHYEHSSKSRIGDTTEIALLHEIEEDDYYTEQLENRIVLSDLEKLFSNTSLQPNTDSTTQKLKDYLSHSDFNVDDIINDLFCFASIKPKLPDHVKNWHKQPTIDLSGCNSREDIIYYLESIRDIHPVADLTFSTLRDMARAPWKPFCKAALERNPVIIKETKDLSEKDLYATLLAMPNNSIYDSTRVSQPDEVWNFSTGDGIEKAFALLNILHARGIDAKMEGDPKKCLIITSNEQYKFNTSKGLNLPLPEDFSF